MSNEKEINFLYEKLNDNKNISDIGLVAYGGSIAYGLNNDNSDVDLRGFFLPSKENILILKDYEQIEINEVVDAVIYSFNKIINLLSACNPNVIEILGLNKKHIIKKNWVYDEILKNKSEFISMNAANTFGGYAIAQLRRLQNAVFRNNNDKNKATFDNAYNSLKSAINHFNERYNNFNGNINIKTKMSNNLSIENILIDFNMSNVPIKEIKSMLNDITGICKNASNLTSRNNKKDKKSLAKHMSHLIRLLRMGSELFETGNINTYRINDKEELIEIKNGKYLLEENGSFIVDEDFWSILDIEENRFEYAQKNNILKEKPDETFINDFIKHVHEEILYS